MCVCVCIHIHGAQILLCAPVPDRPPSRVCAHRQPPAFNTPQIPTRPTHKPPTQPPNEVVLAAQFGSNALSRLARCTLCVLGVCVCVRICMCVRLFGCARMWRQMTMLCVRKAQILYMCMYTLHIQFGYISILAATCVCTYDYARRVRHHSRNGNSHF